MTAVPRIISGAAGWTYLVLLLLVLVVSCGRMDDEGSSSIDPLVIGTYTTFDITDGDTFRIPELTRGIRFLFIDVEETPHDADAGSIIDGLAETWPEYYYEQRSGAHHPVKSWSPLGYEAAQWAREWFAGVDSVRLERDLAENRFGYYGRYLAYVIAFRGNEAVNYNIECVRRGYSPYFTKYGLSHRFHTQFLEAEREAKEAGRGIWDPEALCYPDYEERLAWWNERAEQIHGFDERFHERENALYLDRDGSYERLLELHGDDVLVLGDPGRLHTRQHPFTAEFRLKKDLSVSLAFPKESMQLYDRIPWRNFSGKLVYATGEVEMSDGQLHIVVGNDDYVGLEPPSF